MRGHAAGAIPLLALVLAGCGSGPAPEPVGDGVLVLEVGGEQRSLRSTLMALGRTVEPPHRWSRPAPAPAPREPVTEDPRRVVPPEPVPGPVAPAPGPVEAEWDVVKLGKGETLIHVARRCLGDGRRYPEIMEWNGWTESDARRLKPDQDVRIRRSALR